MSRHQEISFPSTADYGLPWVPEAFLAYGGNFRCWPKANTSSAVGRSHEPWQKPETALEKTLAPRVTLDIKRERLKSVIFSLPSPTISEKMMADRLFASSESSYRLEPLVVLSDPIPKIMSESATLVLTC